MVRTALILPVRNAGPYLDQLLPALAEQTLKVDEWLVVDSESSDDSVARFAAAGAMVKIIDAKYFNHGGTREWARQQIKADIVIYMTQDAIPANPQALQNLRDAILANDSIAAAYGRQLPRSGAGVLEGHSRSFNYPEQSRTKRFSDAPELGIKTCFSSDAFAAYRNTALDAVGGFPADIIGTEDAYVAGKMLLQNWCIRYEASAEVFHSHHYTLLQEFRRYFDIGVFYGRESWIGDLFGKAGSEGRRFLASELQALSRAGQRWRHPEVMLRVVCKLAGYRLGHLEKYLPRFVKRHIGMFAAYWK
ncbi:glycosyltransferase family 2 protein [Iodobacter sp. HSC-16F04]|uniref:Glycosyltransferase family 2 protein n=1 Tax=Iodobacter violaceini TaxID=3044271 RepID=A0ABX0KVP8_9NEIS|nr:glycosyltransferase family 2 protein [Iodobacter violacea]NHQ86557.1 glycosyltransferase family 2 protein [Iodobacter violacea]